MAKVIGGRTDEAQAFILLHELAHALQATRFLPDARNSANLASNDHMVDENCKKTIDGFRR